MKENKFQRRQIAARQILDAMNKKGLSRAQLAEKMGRGRSEVTKWLSGNHNFTLDLLSELSQVLETPITGVIEETVLDSYKGNDFPSRLNDVSSANLTFSGDLASLIIFRASKLGKSVEDYLKSLLDRDEDFVFPKVDIEKLRSRKISKFAGIVKVDNLPEDDEKLMRIWNR